MKTSKRPANLTHLAAIGISVLSLCGCSAGEPGASNTTEPAAIVTDLPEPGSRATAMLDCMISLGYSGEVAVDGTLSFPPVPVEQNAVFQADLESCSDQVPYVPLNETQIHEMYELELDNKTCLEGLGYVVAAAPSEDVYIDTYNTADWWFAIASLGSLPAEEFQRAVAACPPPTFFN